MTRTTTAAGVALVPPDLETIAPSAARTDPISGRRRTRPLSTRDLLTLLYEDLKALAIRVLSRETPGRCMEPTELVHESFIKLAAQTQTSWQGKTHFMAVSAQAMRRILIDDARARTRKKRGGKGRVRVELQDYHSVSHQQPDAILIVDEIVNKLADLDPVHARILELRLFEGLGPTDTAQVLGVSSRTVERHWAMIRAWTLRELARRLPEESDFPGVG